jgi:hypothetical protein
MYNYVPIIETLTGHKQLKIGPPPLFTGMPTGDVVQTVFTAACQFNYYDFQ